MDFFDDSLIERSGRSDIFLFDRKINLGERAGEIAAVLFGRVGGWLLEAAQIVLCNNFDGLITKIHACSEGRPRSDKNLLDGLRASELLRIEAIVFARAKPREPLTKGWLPQMFARRSRY